MTRDEVAKRLVGAWRYIGTKVDGVNKPRGSNPKGMIYYGPHGEMSVQVAPDVERKRAGAVMTAFAATINMSRPAAYARLARLRTIVGSDLDQARGRLSMHLALLALQQDRSVASRP